MKILLLGAPGAGKGTLSEYLLSKNFIHISTGNIFRKVIDENLSNANELKEYILKGLLVPDEVTNKIVKEYLNSIIKEDDSIVFDGYPRSLQQAEFLNSILDIDKVIYLNVNDDLIMKRLTGRRMCDKCKKIYNIYFSPPIIENICDNDGSTLTQRKDDNETIIKDRIDTYQSSTAPLIDYYSKLGKLIEIDGSLSKNEICKKIDLIIK